MSVRNGVVEVVVAPRSTLIGLHLFRGQVTPSGDLVVMGLQRAGEDLTGPEVRLQAGDTMLLRGAWDHLEQHTAGPDLLVVDSPKRLRRAVPLGRGAKRALIVLAGMVGMLAFSPAPPAMIGVSAALLLVASGVLTPSQAYRAVSWTTVLLIAGMMPLSTAFRTTGAADLIADLVMRLGGHASAHLALAVLCLMTALLGQLISNVATVLIMLPIAVSLAADLQVSVLPFLMALAVAGRRRLPDPGRHPGQHHGDGSGRLPLRRLLEAWAAVAGPVPGGRGLLGAAVVALPSVAGTPDVRGRWSQGLHRRVPEP